MLRSAIVMACLTVVVCCWGVSGVATESSKQSLRNLKGTADCYVDGANRCPVSSECQATNCSLPIPGVKTARCPDGKTADYLNLASDEYEDVTLTADPGWMATKQLNPIVCLKEFGCNGCTPLLQGNNCLKGGATGNTSGNRIPTQTDSSNPALKCNDPSTPADPTSPTDPTTPTAPTDP